MHADGTQARVTVRSEKIADPGPLPDLLPHPAAVAWVRDGEGFVGWGEAARVELSGPDRFRVAERWWQEFCGALVVEDELAVPGSGPLALASYAFADEPTASRLIVPRVVIGRRDGVAWRTVVGPEGHDQQDDGLVDRRSPAGVRFIEDRAAVAHWRNQVADAVAAIRSGDLAKVVLALPTDAVADEPIDARELLVRLLDRYPGCWGFLIDGLVGATPELLVERFGTQVRSRVLAGTLPRDGAGDDQLGAALLASAKDLSEHRLAADPVAEQLSLLVDLADVPDGPSVLELPNVVHLATEMRGRLRSDTSALALAGALHPTPAVAGTPPDQALALLAQLEDRDRGRYAGPVGWVDGQGDGEFCLALRCAEVSGTNARLYAGCGIVADSDPDAEVVEWRAKLRPVIEALTSAAG
jgi:menaquinone-specific isochorismate synthase